MRILLRHIDFQQRSLAFELEGPVTEGDQRRLNRYIKHAQRFGLSDIHVHARFGKKAPSDTSLSDLQKHHPDSVTILRKPHQRPKPHKDGRSHFAGLSLKTRDSDDANTEYRAQLTDFSKPFDELHGFIVLVCKSERLDEESSLHLRVCLDELVTNTIDHGQFGESQPCIDARVRFHANRLEVSYEDNAEEFHTAAPRKLDMETKLRDGKKRGFGLFMIHTIVNEIRYTRKNGKNITIFSIFRTQNAAVEK